MPPRRPQPWRPDPHQTASGKPGAVQKEIIGPDGAPIRASGEAAETRGDPALVKALARAFRWRRLLEEGRYASIRELATKEGVDRTYVSRVLNLTLLPPDMVDAILDGRESESVTLSRLIEPLPLEWARQEGGL